MYLLTISLKHYSYPFPLKFMKFIEIFTLFAHNLIGQHCFQWLEAFYSPGRDVVMNMGSRRRRFCRLRYPRQIYIELRHPLPR